MPETIQTIPIIGDIGGGTAVADVLEIRQTLLQGLQFNRSIVQRIRQTLARNPTLIQRKLNLLGPAGITLLQLDIGLSTMANSIQPGAIPEFDLPGGSLVPRTDGSGVDFITD